MKLFTQFILFCIPLVCISQTPYLKYYLKEQQKKNKSIGWESGIPLKTLGNTHVSLNNFKGKILVVDIWYGNCGPCFQQIPYLEKIKEVFKTDTNIVFINACCETSDSLWRSRIKEMKITGLNLLDERKKLTRASVTLINDFGFEGYPAYAFIDANGKFQGATYVKPQDYILFAYYILGIAHGRSLNESYAYFRNEIRSDTVSLSFKKFLTDELLIKENEVNQAVAVYKPFLK